MRQDNITMFQDTMRTVEQGYYTIGNEKKKMKRPYPNPKLLNMFMFLAGAGTPVKTWILSALPLRDTGSYHMT